MQKRSKEHLAKMRKIEEHMMEESRGADLNRARAVTVGTSFGGTVELMMRHNNGSVIWAAFQPVETIELIHQLAAGVGCHLHLTPRRDFATWRDWHVTEEERLHLNGHPPFPNDISPHQKIGRRFGYEEFNALPVEKDSEDVEPALAVEKPKKRDRVKRAAAAS